MDLALRANTDRRNFEIGGLTWDEINFEGCRIDLAGVRTKNHRPHSIPLSEAAFAIIRNISRRSGRDYLFGIGTGPFSGWSKSKQRLDQRLGSQVGPWTVHDLRRTFATLASDHDFAAVHVIEMALNHWSGTKGGIVGTYNQAKYDRERRRLMESWGDFILRLVERQK